MSANNSVKIILSSFDNQILGLTSQELAHKFGSTGALVSGPIPLPRKVSRFTVNRSPHIDKKSREQFEMRTFKRLVVIKNPTAQIVEEMAEMQLPTAVGVKIKYD